MISNEIRFDCQHRDDGGPLWSSLTSTRHHSPELIDGFETTAGKQPAGEVYGGLIPEVFRCGSMKDHCPGRSTGATGAKTPVLGCECGERGCRPLMTALPRPRTS
ncbi:hypothetical protein ACGFYE_04855 [Streptomyces zaomyceticus]|uniref:hypothetical protein n=1 Tax=Streptomyces zaomyceticus TaxID=68286 RepID=UPI00371A6BC7